MGFLDRFKKNETKQTENRNMQPPSDMVLNFSSGAVARITFKEGEYVEDKYLSKATIGYIDSAGNLSSKNVYIEPELVKGEDGLIYDTTKEYYTQMGQTPHTKGFFKKEFLDQLETNYIGRLDLTGQKPERIFDKAFRARYYEKCKREKEEAFKNKQINEDRTQKQFEQKLIEETYTNGAYDASCRNFDEAIQKRRDAIDGKEAIR